MPLAKYRTFDFDSARDFFHFLLPTNKVWGHTTRAWVFRGHRVADWPLMPSAFRQEAISAFIGREFKARLTADKQRMLEHWLLLFFAKQAVRQGLALPEVPISVHRQWLRPYSGEALPVGDNGILKMFGEPSNPKGWPPVELLPVLGLAQHHGVPTRLLDWSKNAMVAAYFASVDAARRVVTDGDSGTLAVWALTALVEMDRANCRRPHVDLVSPAPSDNDNLKAQEGVFTLVRDPNVDLAAEFKPIQLDVEVLKYASPASSGDGALYDERILKLTLPWSEAPRLLELIDAVGVSGATLFPGFGGVTRGMQEMGLQEAVRRNGGLLRGFDGESET